jgi:Flp pilus assembly pilin Flp
MTPRNLKQALVAEQGQALVEYTLVIALVSLLSIVVLSALGTDIAGLLGRVSAAFESALP